MKSQHEQHVDFSQVEVVTHKWKVLIDISWSKQQHHRHCTIWFAEVAQNSCDDENQHQTNFHRNEKWMFSLHSHFHLCALMWKNGQFAALFVWYSSWPGSQIYHDNTAVVNNVWHMKREWFLSVDLTLKYFSVFAKKKTSVHCLWKLPYQLTPNQTSERMCSFQVLFSGILFVSKMLSKIYLCYNAVMVMTHFISPD